MKEKIHIVQKVLLEFLPRVRGVTIDLLATHPKVKNVVTRDAVRKHAERTCEKGILACSPLPGGGSILRLSHHGVRLTGAPKAWAASPTAGIASEMIAASTLALKADFEFPTCAEVHSLLDELSKNCDQPRLQGRLLFRTFAANSDSSDKEPETRLHYLLAELRTPENLQKRVEVVVENLKRTKLIAELIELGLFGITVAVPSAGAKTALETKSFPVETSVVIVEELKALVAP
jgi:hypothetical protein